MASTQYIIDKFKSLHAKHRSDEVGNWDRVGFVCEKHCRISLASFFALFYACLSGGRVQRPFVLRNRNERLSPLFFVTVAHARGLRSRADGHEGRLQRRVQYLPVGCSDAQLAAWFPLNR